MNLWVADENALDSVPTLQACTSQPQTICNRFDISQVLTNANLKCRFSDFDFSHIADNSLNNIFYRVSKEKQVVHHIINNAFRKLAPSGKLFISGQKTEGTKTYWDKVKKLFGSEGTLQKQGTVYSGALEKNNNIEQDMPWLDTKDYEQLRPVAEVVTNAGSDPQSIRIYSKPGLFGWNKVDQGSAFLIEHLPNFIESLNQTPESLLDLGCGYGYLTLMTKGLPLSRRTATDNNAAAIIAARENFSQNQLPVTLLADDCGHSIDEQFDMILCNPPFHQGFSVDSRLTDKFLQQTQLRLSSKGAALFVVNQFIPLERKAKQYFSKVEILAENRSFKLVRLAAN